MTLLTPTRRLAQLGGVASPSDTGFAWPVIFAVCTMPVVRFFPTERPCADP